MQLTAIFCFVDDFCKKILPEFRKNLIDNGRKIRVRTDCLSEAEIITILIWFNLSGFNFFGSVQNSVSNPFLGQIQFQPTCKNMSSCPTIKLQFCTGITHFLLMFFIARKINFSRAVWLVKEPLVLVTLLWPPKTRQLFPQFRVLFLNISPIFLGVKNAQRSEE